MTRVAVLLALLVFVMTPAALSAPTHVTEWKSPARITQLRRADVDGDGVTDVLLASDRRVFVWTGSGGKAPTAKPSYTITLDDQVSFADVVAGKAPALRVIGRGQMVVVDLATGAHRSARALEPGVIAWRDSKRVTFLDLARGDGLLVPARGGWILEREGAASVRIALRTESHVQSAGPFLEDTATATTAMPAVHVAGSPVAGAKKPALWGFSGRRLVGQDADQVVEYDVSFLPREGDRRLLDIDDDGLPDVVHRKTSNRDGQYAFFKTRPAELDAGAKRGEGPPHVPAQAILRLSGYQLDPDLVDLDGDGRPDFVITTVEVDAKNTLRAMSAGTVTARTQAFRNRSAEQDRPFLDEPDAVVVSDMGVKLRFTYAGTIEVKRQLTIVVDGDFDGDGRMDLAIRTGPKTLRIRRGLKSGIWEPEGRDVEIPPIGDHTNIEAYAADTDGDGRDELLLIYRAEGETPERFVHVAP